MSLKYRIGLMLGLLVVCCPLVQAEVSLPKLLSDGLILQRDIANRIWGWANEGEEVVVKLDGQEMGSAIARNGEWLVLLEMVIGSLCLRSVARSTGSVIVDVQEFQCRCWRLGARLPS